MDLFDLHKQFRADFVYSPRARVLPYWFSKLVRILSFNCVDYIVEEDFLLWRVERRILKAVIFDAALGSRHVIVSQEAETSFEEVVTSRRLDKRLTQVLLANLVVCFYYLLYASHLADNDGQICPLCTHWVCLRLLAVQLIALACFLVEFESLFIVVVFFKLLGALFAQVTRLARSTGNREEIDSAGYEFDVLARVSALDNHCSVANVISLESFVRLTLSAL